MLQALVNFEETDAAKAIFAAIAASPETDLPAMAECLRCRKIKPQLPETDESRHGIRLWLRLLLQYVFVPLKYTLDGEILWEGEDRDDCEGIYLKEKRHGEGVYVLPSLPPGNYQMTANAPGFQEKVLRDLTLEVAGKSSLIVVLNLGSQNQSVTVDAGGVQVDATDASISTVVDQKFVENISLNGRSFQPLLTSVPGVTVVPSSNGQGYSGELSVNGMRIESNY